MIFVISTWHSFNTHPLELRRLNKFGLVPYRFDADGEVEKLEKEEASKKDDSARSANLEPESIVDIVDTKGIEFKVLRCYLATGVTDTLVHGGSCCLTIIRSIISLLPVDFYPAKHNL